MVEEQVEEERRRSGGGGEGRRGGCVPGKKTANCSGDGSDIVRRRQQQEEDSYSRVLTTVLDFFSFKTELGWAAQNGAVHISVYSRTCTYNPFHTILVGTAVLGHVARLGTC